MARKNALGDSSLQGVVPEPAPVLRVREVLLDLVPVFFREFCKASVASGDQGFEACADQSCQYRGCAARGDSGQYRRAVDDRRHDEVSGRGVVDNIDRAAALFGHFCNTRVDGMVICRSNDETEILEILILPAAPDVADLSPVGHACNPGTEFGRDHCHLATGAKQQCDFSRGDFTTADHYTFLLFDVEENREKIHQFQCLFRGSGECIMSP